MNGPNVKNINRREFFYATSLMSATVLLGLPTLTSAEPPPEITKIRLAKVPAICLAPQYLAEELLRLEGFSQVEYVAARDEDIDNTILVADGRVDLTMEGATALVPALDAGRPIVLLAGVHGGCYELFGNEGVRTIRDLKGKNVAVALLGAADHIYIAAMMAYVGMDPRKDVNWVVTGSFDGPMDLFVAGKVDAFMGFPPQPQRVRAKKIGPLVQVPACIGRQPSELRVLPVLWRRGARVQSLDGQISCSRGVVTKGGPGPY